MHLKRLHECWCTLSSADALCEYICTNSCAQNRRILKKNGYQFFVWVPLVEIGFSDLYSVWKVILSNGLTCVGIHILVLLVFCTCTLHCLKSRAFLVVISRDLSVHHSVHCFVWIPSLKSTFRVYSWEKAWTFLKSNDLDHIQSGTYRISETKSVYQSDKIENQDYYLHWSSCLAASFRRSSRTILGDLFHSNRQQQQQQQCLLLSLPDMATMATKLPHPLPQYSAPFM